MTTWYRPLEDKVNASSHLLNQSNGARQSKKKEEEKASTLYVFCMP
jgi:hypothetical protein